MYHILNSQAAQFLLNQLNEEMLNYNPSGSLHDNTSLFEQSQHNIIF